MKKRIFILAIAFLCIFLVSCQNEVKPEGYQAEANFTITVSQDLLDVADIYVLHNKEQSENPVQPIDDGIEDYEEKYSDYITILDSCSKTFTYSGTEDEVVGFCIAAIRKTEQKAVKEKYILSVDYSIDIKTKTKEDHKAGSASTTAYEDNIDKAISIILPVFCYYEVDSDGNIVLKEEAYSDGEKTTATSNPVKVEVFDYEVALVSPEGYVPSEFSKFLLENTLTKREGDTSKVNTAVVFGKTLFNAENIDFSKLVTLASKGGEIIFMDINRQQFEIFITKFLESYENNKPAEMTEDFKSLIYRLQTVGSEYVCFDEDQVYSIIALRNSNIFIVPEIKITSDSDLNDLKEIANALRAWALKQGYFSEEREAKALENVLASKADVQGLKSAQIVDDFFIATAPYNFRERKVPVHVRYYIWTAHSLDTGHDFYIVEQEVNAENQKWYCAVQDQNKWMESKPFVDTSNGDVEGSYGPYMSKLTMDNRINSKGKGVVLTNYSPVTQSGTTSVSTGFSWNLGGNIGLSGFGLSGGPAGGIAYSDSTTENVSDINIVAQQDGSRISWNYNGCGIKLSERPFHWAKHTLASGPRVDSLSVKNSWVWDVDNKYTAEVYTMDAKVALESEAIDYNDKFFSYQWWTYHRTSSCFTRIALTPPSRFKNNYLLQANTPDSWDYTKKQAFENFMIGKFNTWYSNVDLYSPQNNLDTVAKNYFGEAVSHFEKNKDVIRDAGYDGQITFYIKNKAQGTLLSQKTITI